MKLGVTDAMATGIPQIRRPRPSARYSRRPVSAYAIGIPTSAPTPMAGSSSPAALPSRPATSMAKTTTITLSAPRTNVCAATSMVMTRTSAVAMKARLAGNPRLTVGTGVGPADTDSRTLMRAATACSTAVAYRTAAGPADTRSRPANKGPTTNVTPSRRPVTAVHASNCSDVPTSVGIKAEVTGRWAPRITWRIAARPITVRTGPSSATAVVIAAVAIAATIPSHISRVPGPRRDVVAVTRGTPTVGAIARTTP